MQWFELVVGVKVRIYKNFNMGWSVRMKYKTNASTNEYANPWYVPGYGKFKSNNMELPIPLFTIISLKNNERLEIWLLAIGLAMVVSLFQLQAVLF